MRKPADTYSSSCRNYTLTYLSTSIIPGNLIPISRASISSSLTPRLNTLSRTNNFLIMKRIYRKNIQPLPMQPHYRQFDISHWDTRYRGVYTLWQIVNNFDGPYWQDENMNVYTPDSIFLFPHEHEKGYTLSSWRTVSVWERISFASNRPEVIEWTVSVTESDLWIVTTDTGIRYELHKIII